MRLVNFSVTNFRSITKAHKVPVSDTTILIGRNNEGKSNLLMALNVGMALLKEHALRRNLIRRTILGRATSDRIYNWDRDFPISLQERKGRTETIIRLDFFLDENERAEFRREVGSNLNGELPITIKIGKDNAAKIEVSKKGKGSITLNRKSSQIANFIATKLVFNYIPAVRTDQEAISVVTKMLEQRLEVLEQDPEYLEALEKIKQLQQPLLEKLSENIKKPLERFLPDINDVIIEITERSRRTSFVRGIDIIVDDGTPTNLSLKGDGVKSLAALGLLKDRVKDDGASIIAIEEPESHLHPSAIHELNEVIQELGNENQVILTTHNPLFVDRGEVRTNIIVDGGKATQARSVKQIRDLLGIKASDNLVNASYVLVVEGQEDVVSLHALLSHYSDKLKRNLNNHLLIIEPIGGAGSLPYKLSLLKNSLCQYHCLLDNDTAGQQAFDRASSDGLLTNKGVTFTVCNGSPQAEFEDCLELNSYKEDVLNEFGVNLDCPEFRNNGKWSDRVRNAFLDQGKRWTESMEVDVKTTVSRSVVKNPAGALNEHKRNSIDALIGTLENLIKG